MQVVVNGTLTNYIEVGSGKQVVLFLHGWGDSAKTFEMLARDITKESKKYRAVLLDLPGFGGSQNPKEAWGLEEYAAFTKSFLKKTGLESEVIIGHSNGGAIAINGLANHVLQAEKLVLLASAGIRNPSFKKTLLRVGSLPAKLALSVLPLSARRRLRQKLYSAIGSDYMVVEHMQDTFKRVVSTDVAEAAGKLKLPVCLIYGENDDATPPEFGRRLADIIPGGQLNLIPKTGHFVHKEQVYKVSRIIREFLK